MQITKMIERDGKQFVLRKFTPMDGIMITKLIVAKASLILSPELLAKKKDDGLLDWFFGLDLSLIGKVLEAISEAELKDLGDRCFRAVQVVLPAGPVPLLQPGGGYAIEELEYNAKLYYGLIGEQLKWGFADFFGESGWISALGEQGQALFQSFR